MQAPTPFTILQLFLHRHDMVTSTRHAGKTKQIQGSLDARGCPLGGLPYASADASSLSTPASFPLSSSEGFLSHFKRYTRDLLRKPRFLWQKQCLTVEGCVVVAPFSVNRRCSYRHFSSADYWGLMSLDNPCSQIDFDDQMELTKPLPAESR